MTTYVEQVRHRLSQLLWRHIREEDNLLSDREMVLKVFERYQKYLKEEIVDVSE